MVTESRGISQSVLRRYKAKLPEGLTKGNRLNLNIFLGVASAFQFSKSDKSTTKDLRLRDSG